MKNQYGLAHLQEQTNKQKEIKLGEGRRLLEGRNGMYGKWHHMYFTGMYKILKNIIFKFSHVHETM